MTIPLNRVFIPIVDVPLSTASGVVQSMHGAALGTTWSVKYVQTAVTNGPGLLRAIEREMARAIAHFSQWNPDSEISRFNRAPAGEEFMFSETAFEVLQTSLDLARATDGAVDPSLGALVNLWGFGPAGARRNNMETLPSGNEICAACQMSGWRRLRLDASRRSVVQPGGVQLDLAGIAKGWTVDQISRRLLGEGVASHMVELGGEIKAIGLKPDQQPWWAEIEYPPEDGLLAQARPRSLVALAGIALATSGDYRRCFWHEGMRYSHTLDSHTGWPVGGHVASVTVLHQSAMLADAWASALTVLASRGVGEALQTARHFSLPALLLTRGESGALQEHMSDSLRAMLEEA